MLLGLFIIIFTVCGKGQRLGKNKECRYCKENTYNDNENHLDLECKPCPGGKGSGIGAESESDCILISEYLGVTAPCYSNFVIYIPLNIDHLYGRHS